MHRACAQLVLILHTSPRAKQQTGGLETSPNDVALEHRKRHQVGACCLCRARDSSHLLAVMSTSAAMLPGAVEAVHRGAHAVGTHSRSLGAARRVFVASKRQPRLIRLAPGRRTRDGSVTHARLGGVLDVAKVANVAGNAAAAAVEVSKAVRMRGVEAPDDGAKSYVAKGNRGGADGTGKVEIDEDGLPLVYDKQAIQDFWASQGGALQKRWGEFIGLSVPFLTRVATLSITGGSAELSKNEASLARDARIIIEKLGPTYIKAGQMMSVRPDVLPQAALDELAILQDAVKPFDTKIAIATIEKELGGPLGEFFDEISELPVAAASLAQVYRAKLTGTDTYVAVKVQRPQILSTVSKDLYVLRRAAEVYQGLIERFAPQQRTDYVALLNEVRVAFPKSRNCLPIQH